MARFHKHWNHFSIEITPTRLAMHQEHGFFGIARADVYVGNTQRGGIIVCGTNLCIDRGIWPIGKIVEAVIGCADKIHGNSLDVVLIFADTSEVCGSWHLVRCILFCGGGVTSATT
jgi:hypothetical protein